MKKVLFGVFLFSCFFAAATARSGDVSLIVQSCEQSDSGCDTQHLTRYDFSKGELISEQRIFTTKISDLRFDLSDNFIYQNRYIITDWGDVLDIDTKSLIYRSDGGKLAEVKGDEVYITVDQTDRRSVFVLNLRTKNVARMPSPNIYEIDAPFSPDKTRYALPKLLAGLEIREFKTKKKKFVKTPLGVQLSPVANQFGVIPIFWIDNERILTQKSNGEIVLVNVNGKVEPIVKIPIAENHYSNPQFYLNREGEIIYQFGSRYSIDLKNKTYKEIEDIKIKDFLIREGQPEPSYPANRQCNIFYQGEEIGRFWCVGVSTHGDFIAFRYSDNGKPDNIGKGIKVWNPARKDWLTIEDGWSPEIIGWIDR